MTYNFILKEPAEGETLLSNSKAVETLIMACGRWQYPVDNDFIYVYDSYWSASKKLWEQVQKASWRDVILDEEMKKTVVELMTKFFDSEDIYKSLGVPWKRGVIFHGPAGMSPMDCFWMLERIAHRRSCDRKWQNHQHQSPHAFPLDYI